MPRLSKYPVPKKRFHGGRWRIYWKWNSKQYSIATAHADPKKVTVVNHDLRLISAALAMDTPIFPESYQSEPAVLSYLEARFGRSDLVANSQGDWRTVYEAEIRSACCPKWADISLSHLDKLNAALEEGIEKATPDQVSAYLAGIANKRSPGTRNRTHNAFARFFAWAVTTKRMRVNPLAAIKRVPERKRSDIVYCTSQDMQEVIALARETGWEEWIAVVVAFYTGMRREEIANIKWEEIRMREGTVRVEKTKTLTSRTLPLNSILEGYLAEVPEAKRVGYIVPIPNEFQRLARLNTLIRKIRKAKKERMLYEWGLQQRIPASKSKKYREYKKQYRAHMKQKAPELEACLERIGWNSFRHTFGSLFAQNGVSLDKISAWMGNSPAICRRHYAQFVPRDRRDEDIDKLLT